MVGAVGAGALGAGAEGVAAFGVDGVPAVLPKGAGEGAVLW